MTHLPLTRRSFTASALALFLAGCGHNRFATKTAAPWVDGLSFLPEDMADIPASGLAAFICDVSEVETVHDPDGTPRYRRTFAACDKALDAAKARIAKDGRTFVALKGSDIDPARGIAAFLQFQSTEPIGNDLSRIRYFHDKGLRVLQFTHHNNTLFAGGAIEPVQSGITPLGYQALAEMNQVGLLPDVAHGSSQTIIDAAKASRGPITYSHGACKALVNHPRCIDDVGIRAIADKGGVVGIFMMSFWLTRATVPTEEHFIAHLNHVRKIGGIDAVGIANDFPMHGQDNLLKLQNDNKEGVKEYLDWWGAMRKLGIPGFETDPQHVVIPTFNNIERMARIYKALEKSPLRFTPREIDRIMGGNWQRMLTQVLG